MRSCALLTASGVDTDGTWNVIGCSVQCSEAEPHGGELVQIHDDRDVFQARPDKQPAIDIHRL